MVITILAIHNQRVQTALQQLGALPQPGFLEHALQRFIQQAGVPHHFRIHVTGKTGETAAFDGYGKPLTPFRQGSGLASFKSQPAHPHARDTVLSLPTGRPQEACKWVITPTGQVHQSLILTHPA